jgi:hypothetical protein
MSNLKSRKSSRRDHTTMSTMQPAGAAGQLYATNRRHSNGKLTSICPLDKFDCSSAPGLQNFLAY